LGLDLGSRQTLDFLRRQAIQAVLTQRRLAEAAASLSLSFRRGLVLLVGDREPGGLSIVLGMEDVGERGCSWSSSAIESVGRISKAPRILGDAKRKSNKLRAKRPSVGHEGYTKQARASGGPAIT